MRARSTGSMSVLMRVMAEALVLVSVVESECSVLSQPWAERVARVGLLKASVSGEREKLLVTKLKVSVAVSF